MSNVYILQVDNVFNFQLYVSIFYYDYKLCELI